DGGWLDGCNSQVCQRGSGGQPRNTICVFACLDTSKTLPRRVGDHRALCDAARVLLPKYRGPAVHLFRGAGALERRRRAYGMSWSADVAAAGRFAEEHRVMDGGSVLLETVAPPEAIISA